MINSMAGVHTTAQTIILSGPFSVKGAKGLSIPVTHISIDAVSHVLDVYVHIDLDRLRQTSGLSGIDHGLELDDVFIGGVIDRLRGIGYQGEEFGRAELGMQESGCIVLEPGNDFGDFALSKGWAYADGHEAYRCNQIMRDMDWGNKLKFDGSDGTSFSIRLSPLIQEHSEWIQKKHGGERDAILREVSIPLFLDKSKTEDALLWLREEADWINVTRFVKIDKRHVPNPKDALAQDPGARFIRKETKGFKP